MRFRRVPITLLGLAMVVAALAFAVSLTGNYGTHQVSANWNLQLQSMYKIADGGRPAWSPSGNNKIAFDKKGADGYYDLWVMNSDGSGQTCITCTPPSGFPARHAGNPSWHPSGNYIAVMAEKQNNPMAGNSLFEWSCEPGMGRNNDLWLVSADGSQAWLLWENPTPGSLLQAQPALLNPRFSHDGTKIAWTHSYNGSEGEWGDYVIRVANFYLTPTPHIDVASMVEYDPVPGVNFKEAHGWTPDDTQLDVAGNWRGQNEMDMDIGRLNLSNGALTNLMPSPTDTWTEAVHTHPGGEKIFYMSSEGYALDYGNTSWYQWLKTDYWMMNPDGTDRQRVTYFNDPGHAEYNGDMVNVAAFSWNPDGTKLAGCMNRTPSGGSGNLEIWVYNFEQVTSTPTPTPTSACAAGNTGWLNPSANGADTGGDGNGFEVSPANAYADENGYASNVNGVQDRHRYYNYGASIPAGCSIKGIEVKVEWRAESANWNPYHQVDLSWNGGTNWTSLKSTPSGGTSWRSDTLGGSADTWGHVWNLSEVNNTNFRARITSMCSTPAFCQARDFYLDWLPIRIYYGP